MSYLNQSHHSRLGEFDTLRALSIIAVVIIHATAPFLRELEIKSDHLYYIFLSINQIQRFCVPVFLMISGFFLFYQVKNYHNPTQILKKRINKIIIPYIIWSLIFKLLETRKNFSLSSFCLDVLTGSAVYVYYFIILIIQCYLLWWIIVKLNLLEKINYLLIVSIILQALYTIYYYGTVMNLFVTYPLMNRFIIGWIFYFVFGLFLGKHYIKIKYNMTKYKYLIIFSAILSVLLSIIESQILAELFNTASIARGFGKLSCQAYAIAFMLCFIGSSKTSNILSNIAKFSFPIYLIHAPIIHFLFIFLISFPLFKKNLFGLFIILLFAALSIPYLLANCGNKYLSRQYKKYFLGI